MMSVCTCTA